MTNVLLALILIDLLYLTWRAKAGHEHSRAEWDLMKQILTACGGKISR